jgi:Prokaryotic Cytochrome C oxidase subunit IV
MMIQLLRNRITAVWLGLVLATLASWTLGVGHDLEAKHAGMVILVIAFVKVRFIGRYFMELRDAPVPLLTLFEAWVAAVAAMTIGLFAFV